MIPRPVKFAVGLTLAAAIDVTLFWVRFWWQGPKPRRLPYIEH